MTGTLTYAVACHQAGHLSEAEQGYREVLKRYPKQFDSLHLLGVINYERGAHPEALKYIDLALKNEPNAAVAHANRAAVLLALKRRDEAVESCDRAIALDPSCAQAFNTRGAVLIELRRFEEALESCNKAIALKPDYAEAISNRGNALKDLKRRDEALAAYDRAIALRPGFVDAHNNRANVLNQLERFGEALLSARRAIELRPEMAEAHLNLGTACLGLKHHKDAVEAYGRAMALNPDIEYLRGAHLHAKMLACDWTDFEDGRAALVSAVAAGKPATSPFQLLPCSADPELQLASAQAYADKHAQPRDPLWRGEVYAHRQIRVAYLSSDFRDHPVSLLTAGVFEMHDRSRFETTAISYGPDSPDSIRERVKAAFGRFIDAEKMTDEDIAGLLRDLEIDIAVDLNGFTDGSRPGVLAQRPVPVQINFLGYSGTLGRACWDYIIADRFVVPEQSQRHYGERVVYLPDCFMPTDSRRKVSPLTPSRAEAGLPASGLVFCSFNNSYKITPGTFDIWMRLLSRVEGSVLWLSAVNASAVENLRLAATARGIASERLVFAPRLLHNEDHLARLRLADLFLDTPCYNAHATSADALCVGVPVITCTDESFASRVAGSLLRAAGLPELITNSSPEYEALILKVAQDPLLLSSIRQKLAHNRATEPLFDTERFTRNLEAAYTTMWERAQRHEPAMGFSVAAPQPDLISGAAAEEISGSADNDDGMNGMNELRVRLKSGIVLAVPAALNSITAYTVLEQEEWFEKETAFLLQWLRPGMTVIDIGANLGVYSLPMAERLRPDGQVFAYEPASEPRNLLERSRSLNRLDNLHVVAAALSDSAREGYIVLGASSELNSLDGSGPRESVRISCLDREDSEKGWKSVDFMKVDAEGEEERILAGAKSFLDRHSPLIMFEIKAGSVVNEQLRDSFPRYGYRVYRLLTGAPVLVPDEATNPVDGFELNMFAAKPDRAAALARDGFLIESIPEWRPDLASLRLGLDLLKTQTFASNFASVFADNVRLDADYRDGLAGYATWRSQDAPLPERCAALEFACLRLLRLCDLSPTLPRLSTLARVTWEAGQRSTCVNALQAFLRLVAQGTMDISEPFWPACPRFDAVSPVSMPAEWLLCSAFEQLERAASFSSQFAAPAFDLDWLCAQPFASAEMVRRSVLRRARVGERTVVPSRLCVAADDHLNADIWRAGLVPHTRVS